MVKTAAYILFLLSLLAENAAFSQVKGPLVMAVSNARLYTEEGRITFTLSIKNNSDSAIYVLRPDQSVFEGDVEPEIVSFREMGAVQPYQFLFESSGDCSDTIFKPADPPRGIGEIGADQLIKLHPDEARIFIGLTAAFNRTFCPEENHTLRVRYAVMLAEDPLMTGGTFLSRCTGFTAISNTVKLQQY